MYRVTLYHVYATNFVLSLKIRILIKDDHRVLHCTEHLTFILASMTMSGTNVDPGSNNNTVNQQSLSKKAFLGSNTSIGRTNRDANIPVRAVSPRVRWVEEKPANDNYGPQQMSTSQQNVRSPQTIISN